MPQMSMTSVAMNFSTDKEMNKGKSVGKIPNFYNTCTQGEHCNTVGIN